MAAGMAGRISIDTPNRARLYDIYTDCLVDLHLTGCIGQRKGKTLQKDFRLVGKDGKEKADATKLLQREWFNDFCDLALDSRFGAQPHTAGRHCVGRERDALRGCGNCTAQACMPRIRGYYARTRRRLAHGHTIPRRGFVPVVRGGGKAQRFGAVTQMRALLHKQEKHAGVLDMFGEIFGAPMRVARTNTTDEAERDALRGRWTRVGAGVLGRVPEARTSKLRKAAAEMPTTSMTSAWTGATANCRKAR